MAFINGSQFFNKKIILNNGLLGKTNLEPAEETDETKEAELTEAEEEKENKTNNKEDEGTTEEDNGKNSGLSNRLSSALGDLAIKNNALASIQLNPIITPGNIIGGTDSSNNLQNPCIMPGLNPGQGGLRPAIRPIAFPNTLLNGDLRPIIITDPAIEAIDPNNPNTPDRPITLPEEPDVEVPEEPVTPPEEPDVEVPEEPVTPPEEPDVEVPEEPVTPPEEPDVEVPEEPVTPPEEPDNVEFDEEGNKIESWYTDTGALERQIKYDENDVKLSETTFYENGNPKTETTFDALGNANRVTEYEDITSNILSAINPQSGEVIFKSETTQDENGNTIVTTTDESGVKCYETIYYTDGRIVSKKYNSANSVLEEAEYDSTGNMISKSEYEYWHGDKIKNQKDYYGSGQLKKETEYSYYGEIGSETEYYENGNTKSAKTYSGKWLKSETEYYENGNIKSAKTYNYSRLESETEYYENGNIKSAKTYNYSRLESETEYYENGNIKSAKTYSNGELKSETEYHENGKTKSAKTYYYGGSLESESYFHENGNLASQTKYQSDGVIDSVTDYYEDGKTIAHELIYSSLWKRPDYERFYDENGVQTQGIYYNYSSVDSKDFSVANYTYYENGVKTHTKDFDPEGTLVGERNYDSEGNVITDKQYIYTANDDGTVTKITKTDGVKTSATITDADGNIIEEIKYAEDGTGKGVTYDKNGNKISVILYDADGNKISETFENNNSGKTTIEYKDGVCTETVHDTNGRIISVFVLDSENNRGSGTVYSYYDNGKIKSEAAYEGDTKQKETVYNQNGSVNSVSMFDADGNKTDSTVYDYYENGNVKTETLFKDETKTFETAYDKDGNKTAETSFDTETGLKKEEIRYNTDDSKTILTYVENEFLSKEASYDSAGNIVSETTYNKDGTRTVTEFVNGILTKQIIYYNNGTVKSDTTFENGKKAFEVSYDEAGTKLLETTFDTETGVRTKEVAFNSDNTQTVASFDSNDVKVSDITYDADGNIINKTNYNNGIRALQISYNSNSYTESKFDAEGIQISAETHNANGTLVKAAFVNGFKSSETTYLFNKIILKEVSFDTAGNITEENSYAEIQQDGETTCLKIQDKTGNPISTAKIYSSDGKTVNDLYDQKGLLTNRMAYNTDGTVYNSYTYSYENYVDSNNYVKVITDSSGNVTKEVYEKGVKTRSHYYDVSTGAVKTTYYDSKGNEKADARESLSGSIDKYVLGQKISLSYKKVYDGITQDLDKTLMTIAIFGLSTRDLIYEAVGDDPTWTCAMLEWAQVGYNETPSGCDRKYTNYEDTEYADFIKNDIIKGLSDDGYDPEWIKGYHFSDTSSLAKNIMYSGYLSSYVKANIEALISGDLDAIRDNRLNFNSGDLYYSLHGTDVVDAKLNGTKLTLTIYDLYDFAEDEGGMLGKTGAAAQKDGKLIPYFMLIDVTIDLKDYFSTKELQELGIL